MKNDSHVVVGRKAFLSLHATSSNAVSRLTKLLSQKKSPFVVGLAKSRDPESHAGSSVAAGRASHTGQFNGNDPC